MLKYVIDGTPEHTEALMHAVVQATEEMNERMRTAEGVPQTLREQADLIVFTVHGQLEQETNILRVQMEKAKRSSEQRGISPKSVRSANSVLVAQRRI